MWRFQVTIVIGAMLLVFPEKLDGQGNPIGNPLVLDALLEASNRLSRPKCHAIFGPNAARALLSANYVVISLGTPRIGSDGKFNLVAAFTEKPHNLIVI